MISTFRRRLTFANVVSALALFVALGGSAAAIGGLGDKQPTAVVNADNEIQACYDKRGGNAGEVRLLVKGECTRREKQILWNQEGEQGPPGTPGATGARGKSSSDPLDSGQTVSGYERFDVESDAPGGFQVSVSLPGRAPTALMASADVNFAPDASPKTTDDDASCTGTVANPTAPAGKACLYFMKSSAGASQITGETPNPPAGALGFRVIWQNVFTAVDTDAMLEFTWAYTAP